MNKFDEMVKENSKVLEDRVLQLLNRETPYRISDYVRKINKMGVQCTTYRVIRTLQKVGKSKAYVMYFNGYVIGSIKK